jgi:hypothetical protein
VLVVVVLLGLSGCGVSATDSAVDVGDAAVREDRRLDTAIRNPPTAPDASPADSLVRDFLMASAPGIGSANGRVKEFLTGSALAAWQDPVNPENPSLTVVRIVGGPTTQAAVGRRTPVTVLYQVVGTLTDQGRVDELVAPTTREMTFWVVPDDLTRPRIDEIQGWPGGLLLSDTALTEYYLVQPIYFWDTAYGLLVPDVRYLPLSLSRTQRAAQVLRWLETGPSPWLGGAVQRMQAGFSVAGTVADDRGRLQVPLAPEVPADDPDALRRYMFQLQWSLWDGSSDPPQVDLTVDGEKIGVDVRPDEFQLQNRSWSAYQAPADAYNINPDGLVEAVGATALPSVFNVPENSGVHYAAVRADTGVAALVRFDQFGRGYLQFVRAGQAGALNSQLQARALMGRPSFVPGTDVVLVPTGGADGRLMAVSIVDGSATDVTGTLPGVSSVSVSPDGRRVAFVAGEQVYVSSLIVANNSVTVGSTPRQILAGQLDATAVAWTSESWLMVGGTAGGAPALWHVTADSVVASNNSANMGGLDVLDLIWSPLWRPDSATIDVLAVTSSGVYRFRRGFAQEPALTNPFYGE